eukprot:Phypoly_transcript_00614.p1 GENE.Phypoly_transcript_00614~~Phypoly_transcript_00614.p1  ORF type:complete len:1365 (+),score=324.67 Phypoly_transcript_00614:110-4204(+)
MTTVELADWEDSKENIKPLRGGRDPLKLSETFRGDPGAIANKLMAERQQFEDAIRNDTSSDPLDTWIRYIRWVQQSYPNGAPELIPLVERCADQFIKNPMYKNDQRYIKVWMHYAHLCKEPLDIFGMLDQHDIGLMVALLYDTKAQFLERKRRYKQAAETFELGLQRSAQPVAWLKRRYEEFQARWNLATERGEGEEIVGDENVANRQVLGSLQANKKGIVSSVRPMVKGNTAQQASADSKKRKLASAIGNSSSQFKVYEDTEEDARSGPIRSEIGASNWGVLGAEAAKEKENTQAPSKWTGHKIPQKKARSQPPQPGFTVYEDEEEENAPAPAPAPKEPKLRAKLDNPTAKPYQENTLIDPHKSETGERTGYNRSLIFMADGMEYSFEEVRAAKYAYIESFDEQVSSTVGKTMEMLSISPSSQPLQPIPLAPIITPQTTKNAAPTPTAPRAALAPIKDDAPTPTAARSALAPIRVEAPAPTAARPALAPKHPALAPRLLDEPVPAQSEPLLSSSKSVFAPLPTSSIPLKPSAALPPLGASSAVATFTPAPQTFSTPLSRSTRVPSSASVSRVGMNSTNFDLSFTASNISFTAGPLLSLSSPTINTREALDVADYLLSGVSPSPSPFALPQQPAKSNLPDDDADDQIDPNQENAPPPNDENNNRGRLTNRDIIAAELAGKNQTRADGKVTNQHFISNQLNRSILDVTSELVDTEEIDRCMEPKGDAFNFEIYEEPTLNKVTTEDVAPARALREIPLKPTIALKPVPVESNSNGNGNASKPKASYNRTPNQSFNDSFSDSLNLRRSTVRKIDNDFFDVSNTSMNTSATHNANANANPFSKLNANPHAQFEVFDENAGMSAKPANPHAQFEVFDENANVNPKPLSILNQHAHFEVFDENASTNANPPAHNANQHVHFEVFDENLAVGGANFEAYSDNKSFNGSSSTFSVSGSRSTLSLSTTTASSGMLTPSRHSKNSTYSGALTPLTPLGDNPVIDPYDESLVIETIYQRVNILNNFCEIPVNSPDCPALDIKKRSNKTIDMEDKLLELDGLSVLIIRCVGEGGYATVYQVDRCDVASTATIDSNFNAALKVQSPATIWEFYIGTQLEAKIPQNMKRSFMFFNSLHVYPDRSFLLMDLCDMGSLQDTINGYKISNESIDKRIMPECLVMYYTIEMLKIVEAMHESGFIHGDLKPDNFLLREKDPSELGASGLAAVQSGLQLLDYGHSIDLSLYPPGAVFSGRGTAAFKCTEMLAGLPWTYQIDTYGLCGIIHCLLHGTYMEVSEQNVAGSNLFRPNLPFRRYWQGALWTQLFDQLLNIHDCHPRPSLTPLRQTFENYLTSNPSKIRDINMALSKRKFNTFEYLKTL